MGKKKKVFRPYDPKAPVELRGDLRTHLPTDHLVFLLEDLVDQLDLSAITEVYEQGDGRGKPPYHPVLVTKLLVYAYCTGETSSRVIMRKTYEDLAYRVLCVNQHPDFRTISDFRERHLPAFLAVFGQTVRLAKRLGQVRLEHVAQDGSKILANASKHKAMSYGRMEEEDGRLGQEIADLVKRAQAADAEEDARYGRGGTGDEVAGEVEFRQARQARIRAAMAALEAEAAAEAAVPGAEEARPRPHLLDPEPPVPEEVAPVSPPHLTVVPQRSVLPPEEPASTPPAVRPAAKEQINFTDAESPVMPSKDGFVQAYNGQAAVDHYRQIIVACDVTDACTDPRQLRPLLDQVRQHTGDLPETYSADTGYWSEENVAALEERGIGAYIPPPRPKRCKDGTVSRTPPTPSKARMQEKLATAAGKRTYSLRKETVEPVFGQLKAGRGLRRFQLRGLAKVRGEWALWCLTHNLLKLAGVLRTQRGAAGATVLGPIRIVSVGSRVVLGLFCALRTTLSRSSAAWARPTLVMQTGS